MILIVMAASALVSNHAYASETLLHEAQENPILYDVEADIACFNSYSGIIPDQTLEATMDICLKAAQSGAQGSQNFVGVMYLMQGQTKKGVYWLTKAAEKGHTNSIEILECAVEKALESKLKPQPIQNNCTQILEFFDNPSKPDDVN